MLKDKVAAIWCRVSTSDQREMSLDSQEEAVRKVLDKQGLEAPPQYVLKVDWTSLDLMACPQFQQLRGWIASGEISAVGVLDRDRLQAQGLQRLLFLSECQEHGVSVITAQGLPMLEGPEGQLVELALALGKERSVLRAQQGARDGLRARALQKGLPPNYQSPYGMKWEDDRLVPDSNYELACDIWRMGLEGETQWGIAKRLTQRGVSTPGGKRVWKGTTIGKILSNRAYAGTVEALKTEAVEPRRRSKTTYGKTSSRLRPTEERIKLEGLVSRPVVTEDEFQWVQERRRFNQRFASKNTRNRDYLLKGIIKCVPCGRVYTGVCRKSLAYYYCRGRAKTDWGAEKCPAGKLNAPELEEAVFGTVSGFLNDPEIYLGEMGRRQALHRDTIESLTRELQALEGRSREERETEANILRLAARHNFSDEVLEQELNLTQVKQRWIAERRELLSRRITDLETRFVDPEAMNILHQRLQDRLAGATGQDRRFVLEAVGATILAQGDGSWELELLVPRAVSTETQEPQIVNTGPRLGWG